MKIRDVWVHGSKNPVVESFTHVQHPAAQVMNTESDKPHVVDLEESRTVKRIRKRHPAHAFKLDNWD